MVQRQFGSDCTRWREYCRERLDVPTQRGRAIGELQCGWKMGRYRRCDRHLCKQHAVEALTEATVRAKFSDHGREIVSHGQQSSEELAAFHKNEIENGRRSSRLRDSS